MSSDGFVIAGGGLAGQRCAETLRRCGYTGAIRIACAESRRPYDRPPLSKDLLAGPQADASLPFKPVAWYEKQGVELLLGLSATALSVGERRVVLSDGSVLAYDRLLIATGSRPRVLPMLGGLRNVSLLRSLDDALALREVLRRRPRLAIVGAGFIGQEVAATARRLGVEVTMIEAAASPLIGVIGKKLGDWFACLHRSEGVEVITGVSIEEIEAGRQVRSLSLTDSRVVETDHVVLAIGAQPDVEWLHGSGLRAESGVPVDRHGATLAEDVFAAGDAAATFDPLTRRHIAGSHWEAAARQGARAAKLMLGLDPGPTPPTSFWTDQYGIRIQYVGSASQADACTIDGDLEERNFTAMFTRHQRAVAALLVGRPHALPAARKLIDNGGTP
ncbi:MAG TPA: FAD-dependent oxidoreductase [Solirubrobacteraceae bacterium]|nr:FAD-dependent oxidoreductase [Solirubrobacteraceae bacterium]